MKIFAWQKGLRGPIPVLFHQGLPVSPETGKVRDENLLATVKLPVDYEGLDLDQLEKMYPYREAA